MFDLTVIIPTFNEAGNIGSIIPEINEVTRKNGIFPEILVVDDNSGDGTQKIVQDLRMSMENVVLVPRTRDPGLSASVIEGFSLASADIILVMDADYSHPVAMIPEMYRKALQGYDIVIGSRYMKGGGISNWPLKRRIISRGATSLGKVLFPAISDPVSGFFAVRKAVVDGAPLTPRGYKILLEVLGKGNWQREAELPYFFTDRTTGESKLAASTMAAFVVHICEILLFSLLHRNNAAWKEIQKLIRYGFVGLSGSLENILILYALTDIVGLFYMVSSAVAIELSTINNFILNDFWTFREDRRHQFTNRWHRFISYHIVSLGGMAVNMAVLFVLTEFGGIWYIFSNIAGIIVAFGWNFLVNRKTTWRIT
jgi:dolichol-phosphate mannosyltransferase